MTGTQDMNIAHAYIIEGDRLSGKRGFALGFARAVLCPEAPGKGCGTCPVCRRVNAGSYEDLHIIKREKMSIGIEPVRELQEELRNKPQGRAGRHIVIIEDADSMTPQAQNCMLKTLEEPEPGTVIMLLSENREDLLPTIRSRCQILRPEGSEPDPEEKANAEEMAALGRRLVETALKADCFNDIKSAISAADADIKDTGTALALIDAIERLLRDQFVKEEPGLMDAKKAMRCVRYAEEARRDIVMKVNHNYAIRDLLLKIGG